MVKFPFREIYIKKMGRSAEFCARLERVLSINECRRTALCKLYTKNRTGRTAIKQCLWRRGDVNERDRDTRYYVRVCLYFKVLHFRPERNKNSNKGSFKKITTAFEGPSTNKRSRRGGVRGRRLNFELREWSLYKCY